MSQPAKPFRIEYNEAHVSVGRELEVFAQHPDRIQILDVTQVGSEMRWRYTIVWHSDAFEAYQERDDGTNGA